MGIYTIEIMRATCYYKGKYIVYALENERGEIGSSWGLSVSPYVFFGTHIL